MRIFLWLLNAVLLAAIVWAAWFWQPEIADETPLPGTHAAKQGSDARP